MQKCSTWGMYAQSDRRVRKTWSSLVWKVARVEIVHQWVEDTYGNQHKRISQQTWLLKNYCFSHTSRVKELIGGMWETLWIESYIWRVSTEKNLSPIQNWLHVSVTKWYISLSGFQFYCCIEGSETVRLCVINVLSSNLRPSWWFINSLHWRRGMYIYSTLTYMHLYCLFYIYECKIWCVNKTFRCSLVSVIVEVDRILRPQGTFIVNDGMEKIGEIEKMMESLKWNVRMTHSRYGEGVISVQKSWWRPTEVETITSAISSERELV